MRQRKVLPCPCSSRMDTFIKAVKRTGLTLMSFWCCAKWQTSIGTLLAYSCLTPLSAFVIGYMQWGLAWWACFQWIFATFAPPPGTPNPYFDFFGSGRGLAALMYSWNRCQLTFLLVPQRRLLLWFVYHLNPGSSTFNKLCQVHIWMISVYVHHVLARCFIGHFGEVVRQYFLFFWQYYFCFSSTSVFVCIRRKDLLVLPYISKFSMRAIFMDCYFQTFRGNNFRGWAVSNMVL